jgi:iron(II)-dependent oxidoreductase
MPTTIQSWWTRGVAKLRRKENVAPIDGAATDTPAEPCRLPPTATPETSDLPSVIEAMLAQQRYCLLLRPQLADTLSADQLAQARDDLQRSMARIPAGPVDLGPADAEATAGPAMLEEVEPLLLDRYPVTNREFRQFVEAGGYRAQALWDAEAWSMVPEFVDLSGAAGPRFWRSGRCASGEDDHPVVGVNWYEAVAYARWTGKRLPTEGEWVRTAAWPIQAADGKLSQRRFPWGDVMDRGRCNVWGSGPGRTARVTQFSTGVSVGGVYQLIGNVWEWTCANFDARDPIGEPLELPSPMKSIRGGAFDTYFEQQACCSFRSGDNPLARKHNIGFRCALSLCDIASAVLEKGSR